MCSEYDNCYIERTENLSAEVALCLKKMQWEYDDTRKKRRGGVMFCNHLPDLDKDSVKVPPSPRERWL